MAPLLLALALLVGDVGRSFYYREAVTNAARQALRVAVNPNQEATGDSYCSGHPNTQQSVTTNLPDNTVADAVSTVVNAAALEATSDGTRTGSVLNNPNAATRITVTWNCDSTGKAYTNTTPGVSTDPTSSVTTSDTIRVQIDYSFSIITPFVGRITGQTIHIKGDEAGRAEYP